jgi:hypothetical protein
MSDAKTRSEYLRHILGEPASAGRQSEALRTALDIRKFEIELYWKRATYFWTFIAASLAGYFLLQQRGADESFESTYVVTCVGFVFSTAWYFVNRGSKAWQRNWEAHVDLLEDEIIGPLYKTVLNRYADHFWDVTAGYHFSPSKINQLLGLFVMMVWLGLIARTLLLCDWSQPSYAWTAGVMSILTALACGSFWSFGRTSKIVEELTVELDARRYVVGST